MDTATKTQEGVALVVEDLDRAQFDEYGGQVYFNVPFVGALISDVIEQRRLKGWRENVMAVAIRVTTGAWPERPIIVRS